MTEITRLIGVYDADGTAVGELSYFLRAQVGRAHCALCDITHGRLRERRDWKATKKALAVPFVTFHRNDQPATVRTAAGGQVPVVLAETADGAVLLLAPGDLESCGGSVDDLLSAIERSAHHQNLGWPGEGLSRTRTRR